MQQRHKQMRRERVRIRRARRSLRQPKDKNNRRSAREVQRRPLDNKISLKLKRLRNHRPQQPLARALVGREALVKAIRAKSKLRASRRPSLTPAPAHQFRLIKTFNSILAQISTRRFSN